jgi:hypothetical protein
MSPSNGPRPSLEASCTTPPRSRPSPPADPEQHSKHRLRRRLVEPAERLLCDLVRQGLSPEAVPAASALILLFQADASARETETA